MKTVGYAAHAADAKLVPYHFERRDLRENDVAIEILYCGVCHSDLHTVNGDWGPQPYPLIPGHEIVGVVTSVGQNVKKFHPGDHVAVGCMVDSCMHCDQCEHGEEQFCRNGMTPTCEHSIVPYCQTTRRRKPSLKGRQTPCCCSD
ncbi:hypothetical protein SK92_02791 [Klebsiella oxytoca]|mgnify:CR=1 FL=1|nr:hypothetical protein SK92_02791 [Klebsiella oxytoca]KMV98174.1 hypothetical protein HMPREF9688_00830 [Klebsiella oxytoca 10-5244]CAA0373108.1 Aldehyde reductase YahK [Klebsiella oxytoca]